jgi:hypothetical protein
MDMKTAEGRYKNDVIFRTLVDTFYHYLDMQEQLSITPTEVREAAILATMMWESIHVRPLIIRPNDPFLGIIGRKA